MVTYDKNEKDLVIPSALGLAGMQDSVCGVTEQEVIEIVESAITDYDTEIQVDLEDIRENVSGNTADIAALSASTVALEQRVDDISTSALTEQIEALSGSVEDIRSDVETLSGDTDSIRTDVAALSAATSGIAIDVETAWKSEVILRGDLTALSARTSAITEQVTELSGVTEEQGMAIANLENYTQEELAPAIGGIGQGLDTLSGVTSGLAVDVAILSGGTPTQYGGTAFTNEVYYSQTSYDALSGGDRQSAQNEMKAFFNAGKRVYFNTNDFYITNALVGRITGVMVSSRDAGVYFWYFYPDGYAIRVRCNGTGSALIQSFTIASSALPNASTTTKGAIRVGSGLTMSGDFLSVKYGDGLGMSGDTLVVSGGTGGGDYLVVDALSAVTSPEEGQMAQVRTKVREMQYIRLYVTDPETYPEEGYWGVIKYEGNGRAIYEAGSEFHWDYGDGNANSGWFMGEWFGYTYEYRCMRPDRDGVEYPEFHIALPENSPLTVEIWDEGGDGQPQGIATAVTAETVYDYSVPAVYTNEVWTPLSKVFTKNDFPDSASTAQVIQEVRAMVARGVYPEVHWNNGILFYESDAGIWITFKNMFDNTNYRLYISDTVFDDNGFDSRGIRFDENGIDHPGTMCLYVDPSGDMEHRDASCLFEEGSQYQLAVKGCELDFSAEYGFGSVVYARKQNMNDEYWYYTWSLIVPTDTGVMKGVWYCDEGNGGSMGDISTYVLDSWTAYA